MAKKPEQIIEPIKDGTFDQVADSFFDIPAPKSAVAKILAGSPETPLEIGGIQIDCYVLDDETRVLSQRGMFKGLGIKRGGPRSEREPSNTGAEIPRFASQKWLKPFINSDLEMALKSPILFQPPSGHQGYGYPAEVLVDVCDAIIEAQKQGVTGVPQANMVEHAWALIRGFAKVGIIALVDEATGYQHDRGHDALRLLLERYIAEGLQKWIQMFPDSFFAELDRLYNNAPTTPRSRPQYYGRFINKYVYDPIEHGYVKSELNKLSITDDGKRKARFHQWLTGEGRTILTRQIGKVEGIMEMCDDIEHFKRVARRQKTVSVAPYLFDEMNRILD